MSTTIFSFDQKNYFVSGLFWQPLSNDLKKELPSRIRGGAGPQTRKLADEMDFDLGVWRSWETLHVGMCSSSDFSEKNVYSIAAAISKTLEVEDHIKNFLCAVEAPNGDWIYVAQKDGVILPDGDACGKEDHIRSHLLNDHSIGLWDRVYAPTHWGISDSEERTLESFLPKNKKNEIDYKKWWRLEPVKTDKKKTITSVVTIVMLGVLISGGYHYYKIKEIERIEAERRAWLAAQQAAIPVTPIWHEEPRASDFWRTCKAEIFSFGSFWPGNWKPVNASCTDGAFSIAWERGEYGWIDHLRATRPDIAISSDGKVASQTNMFDPIERVNNKEPLPEFRTRLLEMHSASQRYAFDLKLNVINQDLFLPDPGSQPPSWQTIEWEVHGSISPDVIIKALEGDAFRLDSIQLEFSDDGDIQWFMKGKQYAKE